MENYTKEQLIEYRDLIKEINDSNVVDLLIKMRESNLEDLLNSLIAMKTEVDCIDVSATVVENDAEAIPIVINNEREQEESLPMVVNNIVSQILTLPMIRENEELKNRIANCIKTYSGEGVDNDRIYKFFRDISGAGQDTLIISGELYKENEENRYYRDIDYHYCYYLDLYKDKGYLYDKHDKNWKINANNVRSVICNAKDIALEKFNSSGLESMIFWKDVLTVYRTRLSSYPYNYADFEAPRFTDVWFSPGIKIIGRESFYNTNVKSVIIPDTMECIHTYAFSYGTTLNLSHNTEICYDDISDRKRYKLIYYDYEEPEKEEPEKKGVFGRIFGK